MSSGELPSDEEDVFVMYQDEKPKQDFGYEWHTGVVLANRDLDREEATVALYAKLNGVRPIGKPFQTARYWVLRVAYDSAPSDSGLPDKTRR